MALGLDHGDKRAHEALQGHHTIGSRLEGALPELDPRPGEWHARLVPHLEPDGEGRRRRAQVVVPRLLPHRLAARDEHTKDQHEQRATQSKHVDGA
jgi:hypothetical protein